VGSTPPQIVCAVTRVDGISTCWRESDVAVVSPALANALARALVAHPGPIVTFNGAGFDFRLLSDHVTVHALRRQLVRCCVNNHLDICFDFFGSHGYFTSLDALLVGSKLPHKTWSGSESATNWKTEFPRVLAYCDADVQALEHVVARVEGSNVLHRQTKKGGIQTWAPFGEHRIRSVRECVAAWDVCPIDNSWMTSDGALPTPTSVLAWVPGALAR
jgi:hypothetical protein